MIIYLERLLSINTPDKSTISAFNHLQSWQKELSGNSCRVWKVSVESEHLSKSFTPDIWCSYLNNRLRLRVRGNSVFLFYNRFHE